MERSERRTRLSTFLTDGGIARGDDRGRSRATTNRANYALPLATLIHARSKIFVPEATENLQRLGITELKRGSPSIRFLLSSAPNLSCAFEQNIEFNIDPSPFHLLISFIHLFFPSFNSNLVSCRLCVISKEEEELDFGLDRITFDIIWNRIYRKV